MKENELRNALKQAASDCQLPEYRKRQILAQMKGEEPVKKKLSASLAIVLVLMLLTMTAAVAPVQSTIVKELFGSHENAPQELTEQIHAPDTTTESALGNLTIDEWLYDGRALHTSFTIANPTSETLLYTLDGIWLNGEHVTYDRLDTEGAGDSGLLLGGMVDGTALPASYALYNQGNELYQFDSNGKYTGTAAIPEGTATLKISMAVWRPINPPEMIDYRQFEGADVTETMDHLTASADGYCQLWLFRPEEYNLYHNASQPGSEVYRDAYQELGWAELVDTIEAEVEINLTKDSIARAVPEQTNYDQGSYQLTLSQFEMSHAGGKLEGWLSGDESTVKQMLQNGLFLVDKDSGRILSSGCYWDDQPEDGKGVSFSMNLIPITGELPNQIYLAPAKGYNECWDEAAPHYDPTAVKPENVMEGWEFDFACAILIPLTMAP